MENTEQEDLDALLRSEGWARFVAYVNGEWGPDGAVFQAALTASANETDDPLATAKLRQVIVTQREIKKLLAWSGIRLAQLAAVALSADAANPQSRQSRRGGL